MKENKSNTEGDQPDFLSKIPKGDFTTPPNYFEQLTRDIQNEISVEKKVWWFNYKFQFGLGGFAILLIAALFFIPNEKPVVINPVAVVDQESDVIDSIFDEVLSEDEEVEELVVMRTQYEKKDSAKGTNTESTTNGKKELDLNTEFENLSQDEIMDYLLEDGYEDGDWDEL